MNLLVPISWLRDYLKTDIAAKTLASQLTLNGPSVERIEKRGEDYIFDVESTSNRSDSNSIYGLAREAHAILSWHGEKSALRAPDGLNLSLYPDKTKLVSLDIKIANHKLCPRFTAIVMDNIAIKDSPALIKNRLETCGIRPINNIVDISNYVMLELGQPMHVFDYDKIKGAKMLLRESKKGESLKTLDGQNRKLPEGTIVIEDAERLVDLCGIMGGENSAVSTRTKRVILFVQAYDPLKIRRTTQTMAFRSDAAARFEKGVDWETIPQVLSRAVYLTKKLAGGKIASELIDIYPVKQKAPTIQLSHSQLSQYMGIDLKLTDGAKILSLLGFEAKVEDDTIVATTPSWRAQDIEGPEDLIEEITRVYGYHNLPNSLPSGDITSEPETDLTRVISLKNALKYLGLTETISYSIISADLLKLTEIKPENAVELSNPLSSEWQFMRPSIIPSLIATIAQNQNLKKDIQIFEIAKTYIKNGADIPTQDLCLTIALQNSNFYEVKGFVENIFQILSRPLAVTSASSSVIPGKAGIHATQSPLFEKSLSAQVTSNDKVVGTIGILNHKVANYFEIDGQTAVAELNLSTVYQLPATSNSYRPIPKFPPIIEDISAIFAKETPVGEVIKAVKEAGKPLVKTIEIIDVYEDAKLGVGKKSITLRIYFQKTDATPTTEEVVPVREAIIESLESNLSAQVRR